METKKIGKYELGEKELQQFIARLPKDQQEYAGQNEEYKKQIVDRLEEIVLFAALADELKIEETQEFKDAMALAARDCLAQMAMQEALKDVEVLDSDVEDFYEENKANFVNPGMAAARHILVDDEEKANEIKAKIEAEEISFEDAAKEHSSCPSAEQGGDLGQFGKGQMVPEFDEAVFSSEAGALVGPVKTQFGYHLILVGDKTEDQQIPMDEVKSQIVQQVLYNKQSEVYEKKLAELKAKYL